jgi:hypothetical protein
MDVEPVGEEQRRAGLEALADCLVELLLREVGHQHRDEVGAGRRPGRLCDLEPVAPHLLPAPAALAHADHDVEAAVLEIERVRASLAAVTEDRDARAAQRLAVDVFVRIKLHELNSRPNRPISCTHKKPRSGCAGAGSLLFRFARAVTVVRRSRRPRTSLP